MIFGRAVKTNDSRPILRNILCLITTGYAVAQWLGIRLQMLGVAMVTGVAFIAVLEHHFNTVNPGKGIGHQVHTVCASMTC